MLAADIVKTFERYEHPIDVADSHVRLALPAFLAAILANAAADDSRWEHGAMRDPGGPVLIDNAGLPCDAAPVPVPQHGRAPQMAWWPWYVDQGVNIGAVTEDEWYWRCPVCRVWAGPFGDRAAAKTPGMHHRSCEHDHPAAVRTEARKAARRVCRTMTAARFDELAATLADDHDLPLGTVHSAIDLTAEGVRGYYSTDDDVVFYTGKLLGTARDGDYLTAPHPRVRSLVGAICAALGYPGWLEDHLAAAEARRERDRAR